MADKTEIKKRVQEEEDYIRSPKFSNSLTKFLAKNDQGVDDAIIARVLSMTQEEVEEIYQQAITALREEMVESEDE